MGIALSGQELRLDQFGGILQSVNQNVKKVMEAKDQAKNKAQKDFDKKLRLAQELGKKEPKNTDLKNELKRINDDFMEKILTIAVKVRKTVETKLRTSLSDIEDNNVDKQGYFRLIQNLINKVIVGLINPNFNTRFSPKQALYLFVVLGELTDLIKFDLKNADEIDKTSDMAFFTEAFLIKIDNASDMACFAEALFINNEHLAAAMLGKYKTLELMMLEFAESITNKDVLADVKAGKFERFDEGSENYERARLVRLVSNLQLPSYKEALQKARTSFKAIEHRRLI